MKSTETSTERYVYGTEKSAKTSTEIIRKQRTNSTESLNKITTQSSETSALFNFLFEKYIFYSN